MRAIAYLRVSKEELDVENQKLAIRSYAENRGIDIVAWFEDTVTGASDPMKRPGFSSLLSFINYNKVDAVVVYALDRIGRSFREVLNTVWVLEEKGIAVISVREEWLSTLDPNIRKLILSILSWAADFERQLIKQRTKLGLEKARQQGKRLGRPPALTQEQIRQAKKLREKGVSYRTIAKILGVSDRTVRRALKVDKITA
ncbi:serine recombinase [uncultured archaeal virus]|jgi:DNA invertase Pin-like site-specific DNA recombinase|uniref:Serine recombinase n=1 Tax=uncultured archaeal virus TaxID=1960247 RepID=A0A1S5Y2X8_9VIRU|nr:serine recombinase [uncultured archaeal virus]